MDSKPRAVDLASESKTEGDCGPSELKRQRTQDEEKEEEGEMDVDDLGSSGMKVEVSHSDCRQNKNNRSNKPTNHKHTAFRRI